ncbi:unnamed protein product [Nesidiocoris tenuis]|uniref:Uncharacterized protein n=1 Tax=Nesidiocoris tenuis TaxID=355587 RepID=A0A6H5H6A0_9HEMI|nr:unnamed protein product [Nesidiocoris tenuis]
MTPISITDPLSLPPETAERLETAETAIAISAAACHFCRKRWKCLFFFFCLAMSNFPTSKIRNIDSETGKQQSATKFSQARSALPNRRKHSSLAQDSDLTGSSPGKTAGTTGRSRFDLQAVPTEKPTIKMPKTSCKNLSNLVPILHANSSIRPKCPNRFIFAVKKETKHNKNCSTSDQLSFYKISNLLRVVRLDTLDTVAQTPVKGWLGLSTAKETSGNRRTLYLNEKRSSRSWEPRGAVEIVRTLILI